MTVNTNVSKPLGRRPVFNDSYAVVDALKKLSTGQLKSRYLTLQLVEKGLVEPVTVKSGSRGRPRVVYQVTGKGRGRIALSRNWKKSS